MIEHHLDHVGIEQRLDVGDGMAGGCDAGLVMLGQGSRHLADQFGGDQRLVSLHVHHDFVLCQAQLPRDLGDAVGAGGMLGARHHGVVAVKLHCLVHVLAIGRDPYRLGAARAGAFGHTHYHGLAADVCQRFAMQAARGKARGNDHQEGAGSAHDRRRGKKGGPIKALF